MKVKILKWNAVATWRWDIPDDDVCGICQVHFDGTCPTCKYPGDDCSLLSGRCGHNFHMHCILEWIKQDTSKGQCPMCRQKFEWQGQAQKDPEREPWAGMTGIDFSRLGGAPPQRGQPTTRAGPAQQTPTQQTPAQQ